MEMFILVQTVRRCASTFLHKILNLHVHKTTTTKHCRENPLETNKQQHHHPIKKEIPNSNEQLNGYRKLCARVSITIVCTPVCVDFTIRLM